MNCFLDYKKIIVSSVVLVLVIFALFYFSDINFLNNNMSRKIADTNNIEELKKAVEENATDDNLKRELSRAYYFEGDTENAKKYIEDAMKIDKNFPQYYVDLGKIYEKSGEMNKAEEMYRIAIELNERKIEPPLLVKDGGIQQIEIVNAGGPMPEHYNTPTPYTSLASIYINQKNTNEAIKVLERGIETIPTYPDFYLRLSEIYSPVDIEKAKDYRNKFELLIKNNS